LQQDINSGADPASKLWGEDFSNTPIC